MKSKKFTLPVIIGAAVLVIAILAGVLSIAKKPAVTEAEFPFSITYEYNGETKTVTDVYTARYVGNTGYADTKNRTYSGTTGDKEEGDIIYNLGEENGMRIVLHTNFYADYMMGDSEYDYFEDEPFEPRILCYDENSQEYGDEETLSALKVKVVSWEYSKPISIISTVLNYMIGIIALPFFTLCSMFIDISGDNGNILIQIFYFILAITSLCIALSIGLRRKLHGIGSLIVQFIGPVVFVIIVAIGSIIDFL